MDVTSASTPGAVTRRRGGRAGPAPGAVPPVSVVICAHTADRFAETCAAVDSVRAQSLPARETIVVVDHNPPLLAALSRELAGVTVVANQHEQGLSGGKNTGVALARGDVIAFLDDDAVADRDWLRFLASCYADPAVIGAGGLTVPDWRSPRPSWFPREFDWVVGCTYRGMPQSRSPVRNLSGGNASFRREAFGLAGGFRSGIGRAAGKRPMGCEETEFCIRLAQRSPGSVLLFEHRAVISHLVPAERARFGYFRSRCYAEGLSKAQVTASVGAADGLAAERCYVTRTLPAGALRGIADALRGDATGLGRTAAIAAGLAATAAGYCTGLAGRRGRALAGQVAARSAQHRGNKARRGQAGPR